MAAGCVPLLMTPYEDIMPNLPFPNAIDWQNTVLFGGGLKCAALTLALALTLTIALALTPSSPEAASRVPSTNP